MKKSIIAMFALSAVVVSTAHAEVLIDSVNPQSAQINVVADTEVSNILTPVTGLEAGISINAVSVANGIINSGTAANGDVVVRWADGINGTVSPDGATQDIARLISDTGKSSEFRLTQAGGAGFPIDAFTTNNNWIQLTTTGGQVGYAVTAMPGDDYSGMYRLMTQATTWTQ